MPRNTYRKTPAELAEQLDTEATLDGDVYRWKSNGQVPPLDLLELAGVNGARLEANRKAYQADMDKFMADYRRKQKPPSAEEMYELRAAFGSGETVVNVITGRRIRT